MAYNNIPKDRTAINDQDDDYLEIDSSGAMVSMDSVHSKAHQGKLFSATHIFSNVTNLNSVETLIETTDSSAHILIEVRVEGKALIEFLSESTFTDNGTPITVVNRNENSDNVADSNIYHTPTINVEGNVFSEDLIPGGSGPGQTIIGGSSAGRHEYIIKPNNTHLFRVTNQSGSESDIFVKFFWYEI